DDSEASKVELRAEKGHSYSHHLFIEQSLMYTKEGGFLIFIIPEFLFERDQADKLHAFIVKNAHIVGLLQLPVTAFAWKEQQRGSFILQKKGKDTTNVDQPLLAMLPSFNDTKAMENMLGQIISWFQNVDFGT